MQTKPPPLRMDSQCGAATAEPSGMGSVGKTGPLVRPGRLRSESASLTSRQEPARSAPAQQQADALQAAPRSEFRLKFE